MFSLGSHFKVLISAQNERCQKLKLKGIKEPGVVVIKDTGASSGSYQGASRSSHQEAPQPRVPGRAHGWTAGLRYKEASVLWSGACVPGTRVQVGRRLDAERDGRAAGNVSASRDLVRVHPAHLAQPDIEPSAPKSLLSKAL